MTASGPLTPPSDEAPAVDAAQGSRELGLTNSAIFMHPADYDKSTVALPACPEALPPAWLAELKALSARYSGLGFGPDLAALTPADAGGLYRFLARVAGGRCA